MSTISASTTSTTAYKVTADTTGTLVFQTGATPTTAMTLGADQSVTFAGTPTYTGGTANGVAYLNGSKVLTTGSALVFDGANLGVGVTPSAWNSAWKAIQIADSSIVNNGFSDVYLGSNFVFDTTSTSKYITTNFATYYAQVNGAHQWAIAPSGTAGNAITFTQAMTLTADGNLGVGTTSPACKIDSSGVVRAQGTTISASGEGTEIIYTSATPWISATNQGLIQAYNRGAATYSPLSLSGSLLAFVTGGSERARIGSNGTVSIGTTDTTTYAPSLQLYKVSGNPLIIGGLAGQGVAFFANPIDSNGYSLAACAVGVGYASSSGRAINAGGTVNASGADYAEYMTKAGGFTVAKGDVVGINAQGKLTNVFADAVSFVVKSTDPSYVGGDTWGSVDVLGQRPNDDASQEVKDAYEATLEAARQTVDRIAFSGQVPVNVTGATAGQYIIPINDNGAIKGVAVSNPTFEQYQQAVGKVIAIEQDGRARIIVKVA
jgi:hypothetical protein